MTLAPSRGLFLTTSATAGSMPANLVFARLETEDLPNNDEIDTPSGKVDASFSVVVNLPLRETVFDSACNKAQSSADTGLAMFGVATSTRALVCSNADNTFKIVTSLTSIREALSVDWQGPNVLSVGMRRGEILLWDTRTRSLASRFQIPRREGDHTGENVQRHRWLPDGQQVVARGHGDFLGLFDVRVVGERKKSGQDLVLQYDYRPGWRGNQGTGFDMNCNLGLIAAADDSGNAQIFGLRTGQALRTLKKPRANFGGGELSHDLDHLKWVEDCGEGEDILMGSLADQVAEWSWAMWSKKRPRSGTKGALSSI